MSYTKIHFNGSKFAGEAPDPIEVLFKRLRTEVLEPSFEPFAAPQGAGVVHYGGNFRTYSHAFGIETDDPELILRLNRAIADNMDRPAYTEAREHYIRTESTRKRGMFSFKGRDK